MLYRFTLDLAIPAKTYDAIPKSVKDSFRDSVRAFKSHAVKINAGRPDEELTVKSTYHICKHDDGLPCDQEQEI